MTGLMRNGNMEEDVARDIQYLWSLVMDRWLLAVQTLIILIIIIIIIYYNTDDDNNNNNNNNNNNTFKDLSI